LRIVTPDAEILNEMCKYSIGVKGPAGIYIGLDFSPSRPGVDGYVGFTDHDYSGQTFIFPAAPGVLNSLDRCGHERGHTDLRR
jgi:hypothetical protein